MAKNHISFLRNRLSTSIIVYLSTFFSKKSKIKLTKKMVRYCKSKKTLVGKTAIVTGSNTGLGYETALEFAKRGCRVILACRSPEKANAARDRIIKATNNENVIVKLLNMESLSSVRDFAQDISETEDRLDLLINNAGAMHLPDKITEDGLQLEMAVNYFSHFLLTILLLDILKRSSPSRIINVSSILAAFSYKINVNKLNSYGGFSLYSRSKLCQIYFTQELAKKLEGTGVTTYSLHPGIVHTEFTRYSKFQTWVVSKFMKSAQEGAQTQIHLALEDDIEKYNGEHFEDCRKVPPYGKAKSKKIGAKLWDVTEELVGLSN